MPSHIRSRTCAHQRRSRKRVRIAWGICDGSTRYSDDIVDLPDKSITPPGKRLNEARVVRGVAQRDPQLFDGHVQSVIEIPECAGRPKPALQFFASDEVTRTFQQHGQNLKRLVLQLDFDAGLA